MANEFFGFVGSNAIQRGFPFGPARPFTITSGLASLVGFEAQLRLRKQSCSDVLYSICTPGATPEQGTAIVGLTISGLTISVALTGTQANVIDEADYIGSLTWYSATESYTTPDFPVRVC